MTDGPKYRMGGEGEVPRMEIRNLATGEVIHHEGIAERALGDFVTATEAGGIEIVVPDDISSLFDDPDKA